jgi:hypothetical protein
MLRTNTSEKGQTSTNIVDAYHEEKDLKKEKSLVFAGIEQLSRKQSNVSKGSRTSKALLQMSPTSNASSLNQEHNETGNFNVAPGEMMNGSKHSFYGT